MAHAKYSAVYTVYVVIAVGHEVDHVAIETTVLHRFGTDSRRWMENGAPPSKKKPTL